MCGQENFRVLMVPASVLPAHSGVSTLGTATHHLCKSTLCQGYAVMKTRVNARNSAAWIQQQGGNVSIMQYSTSTGNFAFIIVACACMWVNDTRGTHLQTLSMPKWVYLRPHSSGGHLQAL
ncbi:hypothetical protein ABBQ32_003426 [Trebouxia sp. C0010 RCD-2024]